MKTLMKRVVAYLLVMTMVVSTVPVGFAHAAENGTPESKDSTVVSTEALGFTINFNDVETYVERGGVEEDGFFRYEGYVYPNYMVTPVSEEFSIGEKNETYFDIYRDGELDYSFEFEMIPEEEQTVENPWGPGNHKINVNLVWNGGEQRLENVGSFDYIIKEIPISGLCFEDVTLTENTDGEMIQEEGGESWYKYDVNQYSCSFTYNDQEYHFTNDYFDFYCEESETWHFPHFETNQSPENPWTPGNDNCVVTVMFGGHTAEFNVVIEENPITGITFTKDTYDVIQGTCQEERWEWIENEDSSNEITWNGYNPYEFAALEVFLANGDSLILRGWEGLPTGDSEEEQQYIYPLYKTNQSYENQWSKESTDAKVYAEMLGFKAEASVNIVDSPVTALTVPEEIYVIENSIGCYEDLYEYDEETGESIPTGEKWFRYYVEDLFSNADIGVQIGEEEVQVLDSVYESVECDGEYYNLDCIYTQSGDDPWEAGKSYPVTLSVLGKEATTMVNVVENPITDVTVETRPLREMSNGEWEYPEDGDKWYRYNINRAWTSLSVTVNDDSTQEFTNRIFREEDEEGEDEGGDEGYFFQYKGLSYPIEFSHNQDEIHWTEGAENVATVKIAGLEKDFNITIAGSPVTALTVPEEIDVIVNSNGCYEDIYEYDEEIGESVPTGEKWFCYYVEDLFYNADISVQTGEDEVKILDSIYDSIEYEGEHYYLNYEYDQNADNPWEVGKSYPVTFSILGKEATTMVNIVESPIEDIELETKDIIQYTNGSWRDSESGEWFRYYIGELWEKATITFNEDMDREPVVIENEEDSETYIMLDGQRYYVEISDNQSFDNQWGVDVDNTITMRVAGFEKDFNVTIIDSPIESIVVEPITILEGTKQCTAYDVVSEDGSEDGWEVEYTKYDENRWEPAYTVTMKDGCEIDGKKVLHFEGWETFYYNGEAYYPGITSNQSYTNVWDEPGAYTATFSLMGINAQFTVNIKECNITSITINDGNPVQLAANIDGYMQYFYDEDDEEYQYFWYNENRMVKNYSIVIDGKTYNSSEDGDIRFEGDWYSPTINSKQSYENQWKAGETYEVEFTIFGKTETFDVEIVDTVVGDITINEGETVELIANIDGELYEDEYIDEGGEEGEFVSRSYFHYYNSAMLKSYSVVINGETYQSDKDGYITVNGRKYEPDIFTNQSYDNQWVSGRTYKANFKILGKTVTFPVKIIDTPVDEIIINDGKTIELIANSDGYLDYDEENDEASYFRYNEYRMLHDFAVVIDGKTYTCNSEYDEIYYNGRYYGYTLDSKQSYENQWQAGNTYEVEFSTMGKTVTFPVSIVEVPVDNLKINGQESPYFKIIENTYGEWDRDGEEGPEYYYYYVQDLIEKFTVEIDGKTYESDKYGYINYNGNAYRYNVYSLQSYENQWQAGQTYDVEFTFMGQTKTLKVEIVENPIESITVEDMSIPVLTNGYYDYYYIDETDKEVEWYRYDLNRYPPAYTLTLKEEFVKNGNATVKVAPGDAFVYEGVSYYPSFRSNQSYQNQWTTENPNPVTADLGGVIATFNVTLTEELPFTVEFNDMTVVEKTHGFYRAEDLNKYEYFLVNEDYVVKDKDGNDVSVEKIADATDRIGFIYDGVFYPIHFSSNQSTIPFEKDKDNIVTCKIGSQEFSYKMKLTDSKVSSIKVNDITIEESNGEYSLWNQDYALVVTIDGETRVVLVGDDMWGFEHNDEWYDVDFFDYQYDYEKDEWIGWDLGINKASVVIGGVKTDFNVRIVCANDNHDYDNGVLSQAPTCTLKGEMTFTCKDCGVTKTETVNEEGHKMTYNNANASTCTQNGNVAYYACSVCKKNFADEAGKSELQTIVDNADGHKAGTAATCISPQTCTICQTVLMPATGHKAGTAATCTSPQTCTICETVLAPASGHKEGAAATCTSPQTCTICQTVLVPATGHKAGPEATCTSPQTCTICQTVLEPATGHKAGPEATCTSPQTCTTCQTVLEPATGHKAGPEATCTSPQTCITCQTVLEPTTGHKAGTAKVTVKATTSKDGKIQTKCTTCGTILKTTVIKKASKVTLSTESYTYNGKMKSPKVYVKDSAGKTISSKYYTVSKPSGRKSIGKYTYTVKFKGNYSGTKKLTLTIKPVKPTIQTPKAEKKAITVKWKKGTKSQVTGYEVMVATNSKFSKNKKTVTVKGYSKVSKQMTKLKAKTKYYVRVRTYKTVKGVKIYSDWSKVKTIKTK